MPNLPIPLKEMTPEQRRLYNNKIASDARERKRLGLLRPRRSQPLVSQAIGSLIKAGASPETIGQKNIYLSIDLATRLENAVAALSGKPLFLDQTTFFEAAVRNYLEALEEVHNDGKPFDPAPKRQYVRSKLALRRKRGRPRKTQAAQES